METDLPYYAPNPPVSCRPTLAISDAAPERLHSVEARRRGERPIRAIYRSKAA